MRVISQVTQTGDKSKVQNFFGKLMMISLTSESVTGTLLKVFPRKHQNKGHETVDPVLTDGSVPKIANVEKSWLICLLHFPEQQ